MQVAIIGAGVQGLCTAYYLAQSDVEVTVFDQNPGPGQQTSMGNGGIFSYALPAGWNSPGAAKMFFNALLKPSKAPIQFRLKALPALIPWGMHFLKYANNKDFIRLTEANKRLASYSQSCLETLLQATGIHCYYVDKGFLEIFENEESLHEHGDMTKSLVDEPEKVKILDAQQVVNYEPSLKPIQAKLKGGILLEADKSGDCYLFCENMASYVSENGVTFHYKTSVDAIIKKDNKFTLTTDTDQFSFDRLVIAAGNGSPVLAKQFGSRLPMKPAKGFSFTLPADGMTVKPLGPIVDITTRSGVNCFGGETLRYVGGAEFAGLDKSTPAEYWQRTQNFFARIFPEFDAKSLIEEHKPWVGFRPVCVDGVPIIGALKTMGAYVITGHGGLGWTQAAGSAKMLVDQITENINEPNSINTQDYSPDRFG